MHAWKHVFVHVDARPHAPLALGKALAVAEAFGGRVTAFDSISAERLPPYAFTNVRTDRVLELAAETRARELREQLARLGSRVPVDASVELGPDGALPGRVAGERPDLILKAVSALDVEQGTSAGTATLRLLRESRAPVWLCTPHRRRTNRVLAAVNPMSARSASEQVSRAGARLAKLDGAELHVVRVAPGTQAGALQAIEKAVFELEPDIVVLGRDGSELTGLPGTHLVERLFCRVECSLLVLPPEQVAQRVGHEALERRSSAASAASPAPRLHAQVSP